MHRIGGGKAGVHLPPEDYSRVYDHANRKDPDHDGEDYGSRAPFVVEQIALHLAPSRT